MNNAERYRADPEYRIRQIAKSKENYERRKSLDPLFMQKRNERNRLIMMDPEKRARKLAALKTRRSTVMRTSWRGVRVDGRQFLFNDFNRYFQIQGGRCKICSAHQTEIDTVLFVDHNHKTMEFRGLLCGACNSGIGHLKDSPTVLERAIEYLRSDFARGRTE